MGEGNLPTQPGTSRGTFASASSRQQQLSDRDDYINPDPLVCLTGGAIEAPVCIYGAQCKAIIGSRAQMLTITVSFIKQLGLHIEQLSQIFNTEACKGGKVPYLSYLEVNLE